MNKKSEISSLLIDDRYDAQDSDTHKKELYIFGVLCVALYSSHFSGDDGVYQMHWLFD